MTRWPSISRIAAALSDLNKQIPCPTKIRFVSWSGSNWEIVVAGKNGKFKKLPPGRIYGSAELPGRPFDSYVMARALKEGAAVFQLLSDGAEGGP